jgi:hypothetical protein
MVERFGAGDQFPSPNYVQSKKQRRLAFFAL